MRRLLTQVDINRYQLDIMDLIDNNEIVYFSLIHDNQAQCTHANTQYNIIFYGPEIEPLVVEFIDMIRNMPEFENAANLLLYGCPICVDNL